jgi:hypothetical protein
MRQQSKASAGQWVGVERGWMFWLFRVFRWILTVMTPFEPALLAVIAARRRRSDPV